MTEPSIAHDRDCVCAGTDFIEKLTIRVGVHVQGASREGPCVIPQEFYEGAEGLDRCARLIKKRQQATTSEQKRELSARIDGRRAVKSQNAA